MYPHGLLEILPMVHNLGRFNWNWVRLCLSENGVDHMRPDYQNRIEISIPYSLPEEMREDFPKKSISLSKLCFMDLADRSEETGPPAHTRRNKGPLQLWDERRSLPARKTLGRRERENGPTHPPPPPEMTLLQHREDPKLRIETLRPAQLLEENYLEQIFIILSLIGYCHCSIIIMRCAYCISQYRIPRRGIAEEISPDKVSRGRMISWTRTRYPQPVLSMGMYPCGHSIPTDKVSRERIIHCVQGIPGQSIPGP